MSSLLHRLNQELAAESSAASACLLVEVAKLSDESIRSLRQDASLGLHPLLVQHEFSNLRTLGPALVVSHKPGLEGLQHLFEYAAPKLKAGLCAWLSSSCPAGDLAAHLASANQIRAPDGSLYLLRYHAWHVLEVLYRERDPWSRAFFAPFISWWAMQAHADGALWRRYPGDNRRVQANPLPLLQATPALWSSLVGGDPEPHVLLHDLQKLQPPVFDTDCPGARLGRVEACLAEATQAGLADARDRRDFVWLGFRHGASLERDPHWRAALDEARQGRERLGVGWMRRHEAAPRKEATE